MNLPTRALTFAIVALFAAPAAAQDGPTRKGNKSQMWEQDEFEEKTIKAVIERLVKAADNESTRWFKEMCKLFPERVPVPIDEAAIDKWFDLLAASGKVWRREDSANKQVAALYDRVTLKMELGPVPSIRRDEFQQFGKKLIQKPREAPKPGEEYAEADRVFRVLDRDGSGVLEQSEWTDRHRTDARKADTDGDRTIDLKEYRVYFDARVTEGLDAIEKPAAAKKNAGPAVAVKDGLPGWFKDLDTDGDGQVDLREWRSDGRSIAEFMEMDLNGDGLLPPDEYLRYVRQARASAERKTETVSSPMAIRKMKP